MNNVLKNSLYTTAWIVLVSLNSVNAAINPGTGVQNTLRTEWTADTVIQVWLSNLLTFLYLVAVVLGIWWGFNILTAGWDEKKVEKWKTIIIQAIVWVVIIFLAGSIIDWLLTFILK